MEKLSIVICTYNSEHRIERVINTILKQQNYKEIVEKFIVIDNNSKDLTKDKVEKYRDKIQYIFEERQGLTYARRKGIENITTKWIVFLDDDNLLEENWLTHCKEYIKCNNNIGAFNGHVYPIVKKNLTIEEREILKNTSKQLACTVPDKKEIKKDLKKHPHKVPFGAGLVIRGDLLKTFYKNEKAKLTGRIGKELLSGEDTEMCLYIKEQGLKYGFESRMVMGHIISNNRLKIEYSQQLNIGFGKAGIILKKSKIEKKIFLIKNLIFLIKMIFFSKNRIQSHLQIYKILGILEAMEWK